MAIPEQRAMRLPFLRAASRSGLAALLLVAGCSAATAFTGVKVLHAFDSVDGAYPQGRLVRGSDGRLYGTTYAGGRAASGLGALFAVSTAGAFTLLHAFDGSDGNSLSFGVVQGVDGRLYGTTPQGSITIGPVSTNYGGTFFRSDLDGQLTTLHKFLPADLATQGYEPGAVVDGGDGFFYAASRSGGASNAGALLRLAADGTVTLLHSFVPGQASYPTGRITRLADGSLVGALRYNSAGADKGALFRWSAGAGMAVLRDFNGPDGSFPGGLLAEAADGSLYGVTGQGGVDDVGTVFRLAPGGALTTLHAFNGLDGAGPVDGLAWGPDAQLYGLTFSGGSDNGGTLFRIGPAGGLQTLHLLSPAGGTKPAAAPLLAADGMLYATATAYGGAPSAVGSVFAFDTTVQQPAALLMDKTCYNEFNTCFRPINVGVGGRYTVRWASANLSSCTASGAWSGARAASGRLDVTATRRGVYTYRLNCSGPGGSRQAAVSVTVG